VVSEKEKYPLWTPLKRKEKACKTRENLSGPSMGRPVGVKGWDLQNLLFSLAR
jgi:hypothetical protein